MKSADIFSLRRALDPPVGIPSNVRRDPIFDSQLANLSQSIDIATLIERDQIPLPSTRDREGYYDDRHFEYWLSGLRDYLHVKEALAGVDWPKARLLDFGGATGRVSRHFYAQGKLSHITICDVNINNIAWVLEHLPPAFGAFKNAAAPTLPFPDGFFDVVIAFSVFTHIDEYELMWLYELRRILRPEGTLYVSVHNDDTWNILPSTFVFSILKHSDDFRSLYRKHADLTERLVFRHSEEDVYSNTFHPNAYIQRAWGRIFKVVEIRPLWHGYQSIVILRNEL